MLLFLTKQAVRSLHRNPIYSAVMVFCLALGVSIFTGATAAVKSHERAPWHGTEKLYHVELDRDVELDEIVGWQGFWSVANMPRILLSYRDAQALLQSPLPSRSTATFNAPVLAESPGTSPLQARVRFCTRELFSLFALEISEGTAWQPTDEQMRRPVALIDAEASRRWFGRSSPLGRKVTLAGVETTLIGVVAVDRTRLRPYDFWTEREPDAFYVPLPLIERLRTRPAFFYPGAGAAAATFAEQLERDDLFVHVWAELDEKARPAYAAFLDRYVAAARPSRPSLRRGHLRSFDDWRSHTVVRHPAYDLFAMLAGVSFFASVVNLVRLLIAKFQARAREVSIRRALGASRRVVFLQHLIEGMIVGFGGALLGLLFSQGALYTFNAIIPYRPVDFALAWPEVLTSAAGALGAGLLSGVYPAWRICSIPPASYLRRG